jgi:hypothetical protein
MPFDLRRYPSIIGTRGCARKSVPEIFGRFRPENLMPAFILPEIIGTDDLLKQGYVPKACVVLVGLPKVAPPIGQIVLRGWVACAAAGMLRCFLSDRLVFTEWQES